VANRSGCSGEERARLTSMLMMSSRARWKSTAGGRKPLTPTHRAASSVSRKLRPTTSSSVSWPRPWNGCSAPAKSATRHTDYPPKDGPDWRENDRTSYRTSCGPHRCTTYPLYPPWGGPGGPPRGGMRSFEARTPLQEGLPWTNETASTRTA